MRPSRPLRSHSVRTTELMSGKLLHALRGAEPLEISRRGAEHLAHRGQLLGDERRIRELSDAEREVNAAGREIDVVVAQLEIELKCRMEFEKPRQMGREMHASERGRREHAEGPGQ